MKLFKTLAALATSFYLGGFVALGSYYVVWKATNPLASFHWESVSWIVLWPWDRLITIIAYCL